VENRLKETIITESSGGDDKSLKWKCLQECLHITDEKRKKLLLAGQNYCEHDSKKKPPKKCLQRQKGIKN
jgi:hypothetical protein